MEIRLTEDEMIELVRCVLVEEGTVCSHTMDDGPTINVHVDDVAEKIVSEFVNPRPR